MSRERRPLSIIVPVLNEGANFPSLWNELSSGVKSPFTAYVVYDFDEESDGFLFLVMPLIANGTLKDVLRRPGRPPWSPSEALRLAQQILPALDFAHQHGLVHRDVKPANILLDGKRAYLVDFGISKLVRGEAAHEPDLTGTSVPIGTPEHMAPERVAGGQQLDGRADLCRERGRCGQRAGPYRGP